MRTSFFWGAMTSLFFVASVALSIVTGQFAHIGDVVEGSYRTHIIILGSLTGASWSATVVSLAYFLYLLDNNK